MSLSRRSLLTRLAALLASVPLLRLRGEAEAATPVPSRPLPPPPTDAEIDAMIAKAQRTPPAYPYEYRRDIDAHWIEGDICVECDVPLDKCIYAMPLKATPPRDGGWM